MFKGSQFPRQKCATKIGRVWKTGSIQGSVSTCSATKENKVHTITHKIKFTSYIYTHTHTHKKKILLMKWKKKKKKFEFGTRVTSLQTTIQLLVPSFMSNRFRSTLTKDHKAVWKTYSLLSTHHPR